MNRSYWAILLILTTSTLLFGCGSSHTAGDAGVADSGTSEGGSGRDAAPDYQHCEYNSECIVVPQSCCGSCGAATRGDALALHRDEASAYRDRTCQGMGCPGCSMIQDPTLVGTCNARGICEVVDLHEHQAAQCSQDGDCSLRTRECCECGGDATRSGLIAIRSDSEGDYTELVCDESAACPECAPSYPDEASATCTDEGYCDVQWPMR
jgi:hypothetical protein